MGEGERTVWDDLKNEANIRLRAIDFLDLDEAFDGRFVLSREDERRDYGEQRFNMLVEVQGIVLNVTFTPRGDRQRIISARVASRKERRLYHARRQDG
ncbi:BrnT family toxin [Methylobacterium oxalidis]|uniref:BrnT family toxin n=1 Tax=Methylobacterium oxalidis TaxID=944322 RepID=A0A512J1Z8_9HYPH|nr:BrnT family toxin [Methylobacterium oxalidis]GEP03984.1 hypothetical protein MOX02_20220 [Methylobacterium oxalidis]GJE31554.1 hypothetical protein LDDCCGHA_1734 [Methylobacterium oxalidis]GLS64016.1 hypothetical protein GCM10007888_23970 [Methylobacterium oxalidis]